MLLLPLAYFWVTAVAVSAVVTVSGIGGVPAIDGVPTPIVNIPSTCVSGDSAVPVVFSAC
jgi:hypothetical protein